MQSGLINTVLSVATAIAVAAPANGQSENFTVTDTAKSVDEAIADLRDAVEEAGATVIAEVDHAAGAESVDMELDPAKLLIFGNPRLGTPPMQDDILAGVYLPLRVLVYEGADGGTEIAFENPEDMFDELSVPYDADYVAVMRGALERLTSTAAATE